MLSNEDGGEPSPGEHGGIDSRDTREEWSDLKENISDSDFSGFPDSIRDQIRSSFKEIFEAEDEMLEIKRQGLDTGSTLCNVCDLKVSFAGPKCSCDGPLSLRRGKQYFTVNREDINYRGVIGCRNEHALRLYVTDIISCRQCASTKEPDGLHCHCEYIKSQTDQGKDVRNIIYGLHPDDYCVEHDIWSEDEYLLMSPDTLKLLHDRLERPTTPTISPKPYKLPRKCDGSDW